MCNCTGEGSCCVSYYSSYICGMLRIMQLRRCTIRSPFPSIGPRHACSCRELRKDGLFSAPGSCFCQVYIYACLLIGLCSGVYYPGRKFNMDPEPHTNGWRCSLDASTQKTGRQTQPMLHAPCTNENTIFSYSSLRFYFVLSLLSSCSGLATEGINAQVHVRAFVGKIDKCMALVM